MSPASSCRAWGSSGRTASRDSTAPRGDPGTSTTRVRPADAGGAARQVGHRGRGAPRGAHGLGQSGRAAVDDVLGRLRRHVARPEARPAGDHDEVHAVVVGEPSQGRGDLVALVGHGDPVGDLEAGLGQPCAQCVPGGVLPGAPADPVAGGDDPGGVHALASRRRPTGDGRTALTDEGPRWTPPRTAPSRRSCSPPAGRPGSGAPSSSPTWRGAPWWPTRSTRLVRPGWPRSSWSSATTPQPCAPSCPPRSTSSTTLPTPRARRPPCARAWLPWPGPTPAPWWCCWPTSPASTRPWSSRSWPPTARATSWSGPGTATVPATPCSSTARRGRRWPGYRGTVGRGTCWTSSGSPTCRSTPRVPPDVDRPGDLPGG